MEPKRQIDGVYSSRPKPASTSAVQPPRGPRPDAKKRAPSKRFFFVLGLVLVVAALAVGLHAVLGRHASLVPKNIQKSVDFSVYYPDPQKLPAGYTLDTKSFKLAQPGVVLFAVTYGTGNNIVFSEEKQPGSAIINKFTNSSIPLHTDLKTSLGQAELGAYGTGENLRTVISLPINNGPWLILTAPPSTSKSDLQQILQTLTR